MYYFINIKFKKADKTTIKKIFRISVSRHYCISSGHKTAIVFVIFLVVWLLCEQKAINLEMKYSSVVTVKTLSRWDHTGEYILVEGKRSNGS